MLNSVLCFQIIVPDLLIKISLINHIHHFDTTHLSLFQSPYWIPTILLPCIVVFLVIIFQSENCTRSKGRSWNKQGTWSWGEDSVSLESAPFLQHRLSLLLSLQVFFVDRGFYDDVSTRHLMEIAPQFVDTPFQVRVYTLFIRALVLSVCSFDWLPHVPSTFYWAPVNCLLCSLSR